MVQEIIEAVIQCEYVRSYDILEYVEEESIEFIHLKIEIKDHRMGKSKYSYHWQKADGTLILRWDNAPHHREILTFPYHLHIKDKIKPSDRVFIHDVLKAIANYIENTPSSLM